jgi:hypothetical protein
VLKDEGANKFCWPAYPNDQESVNMTMFDIPSDYKILPAYLNVTFEDFKIALEGFKPSVN